MSSSTELFRHSNSRNQSSHSLSFRGRKLSPSLRSAASLQYQITKKEARNIQISWGANWGRFNFVSSSWDKLTLATEEGTKLVCSSLFFLAFYKDRYKNRHGKMRRLFTWELSVRVCQDEWVRVCVLQDKRGEELLLVRPRTTYWASRTSSERARTRETSRTWQHNHQGQVCRETIHTLWSWTR